MPDGKLRARSRGCLRGAALACAAALSPGLVPAATHVTRPDVAAAAVGIVAQTNDFRRSAGLGGTPVDARLSAAAATFAAYMARTGRYGHEADGREPAERAMAHGYAYCTVLENIAYVQSSAGFQTPELAARLARGRENSPDHRKNMLDPAVTQTGVAIAQSTTSGRFYAVQLFGRPLSLQIEFGITNESDSSVRYVLGEQHFELPPRATRTHRQCRVERLALQAASARGAGALEPAQGQQLVVRGTLAAGLRLEAR